MTTRRAVRTRQARPTGRAVPGGPAAVAGAVLVLALAACSPGESDESPSPSSTATSASPSPTDSPSTTPEPGAEPSDGASTPSDDATEAPLPFPANTEPDTQDPSADAALTVTDVRVGHHDGFDRVVFELGGTGTPGWRVEYVDQPVDDGKGDVVAGDGDAALQGMISGSGYPKDTGGEEF
ncbi:AMIN-like domain-containing (lipo)protein, partial [Cellulosimicrobium funkei]|uniref:AMIN-like domain-containing (lipo)protein n=1 Tax=Cellulosimicrobium funkei TaxID=264251 RepID=UPI003F9312ED